MAWTPLSNRLSSLPLLLAGPIVRRTEYTSVTVWFVLKEQRNVTLEIFNTNSLIEINPLMSGNQSSGVCIGDHIYIYCVTASGITLNPGTNYYYDINFGNGNWLSELISGGLDLTFDGSQRPSFAIPPDNLDQVRLVHGSCRKPHGEGYDAMEGVHDMIQSAVTGGSINAIDRPHQLFMTGDQIYADDVADVMLFMIDDTARVLFNWDEDYSPFTAAELAPGKRNTNNRIRNDVGFTGMLPNKPVYSKSHLLKFREYATMYLFAWSDALWPNISDFPHFQNIYPGEIEYDVYDAPGGGMRSVPTYGYFLSEVSFVKIFRETISKVRKALANVSTYMVFDDHEITDDWNLNWRWCKEVYSKHLGRRTVQNGLLAYALFQAWGNTPAQFNEANKRFLLDAATNWRGSQDSHFAIIKSLLNIPTISPSAPISDFPHNSGISFHWHYNVQMNHYAIYCQDSRTWRGYPNGRSDIAFAKLITQEGYNIQLPSSFPNKDIYLIIAPCPVLGEPFIEEQQKKKNTWEDRCDLDTEAWSLDQDGFERLFSNLSSRLSINTGSRSGRFCFLSGDVHYGLSSRCQIWGNTFLNDSHPNTQSEVVFAQLTASSFKNQTFGRTGVLAVFQNGTLTLHNGGYPISITAAARNVNALPTPQQEFVWLIGNTTVVGKFRPGTPSGLWDYGPVQNGLLVRSKSQLQNDHVESISLTPNWRYRTDWILGQNSGNPRRTSGPTALNGIPSRADYLRVSGNHRDYMSTWGNGKEIVGVNNLGEIRFSFNGSQKSIRHIIWWRLEPRSGSDSLQIFPLTTYTIPMNFTGDRTTDPSHLPITQPTYNGL